MRQKKGRPPGWRAWEKRPDRERSGPPSVVTCTCRETGRRSPRWPGRKWPVETRTLRSARKSKTVRMAPAAYLETVLLSLRTRSKRRTVLAFFACAGQGRTATAAGPHADIPLQMGTPTGALRVHHGANAHTRGFRTTGASTEENASVMVVCGTSCKRMRNGGEQYTSLRRRGTFEHPMQRGE